MSNELYPAADPTIYPGLAWSVKRTPTFSTKIQTSTSGREVRVRLQQYPLDDWELVYSRLLQDTEFANVIGFYKRHSGAYDSFLLTIPSDSSVVNQLIGIGDGAALEFAMARTIGNYSEPVENCIISSMIVNNVTIVPGTWLVESLFGGFANYVRLNFAPGAGQFVSATFTYSWRVRFKNDTLAFENFLSKLWSAKSVPLKQVRGSITDVQQPPILQSFIVPIQGFAQGSGDASAFSNALAQGAGTTIGDGEALGVGSTASAAGVTVGTASGTSAAAAALLSLHTAQGQADGLAVVTAVAPSAGVGSVFRQFDLPGVGYLNATGGARVYNVAGSSITESVPGITVHVGTATGTGAATAVGRSVASTGAGLATSVGAALGVGAETAVAAGTSTGAGDASTTSVAPPPPSSSTFPTRTVKTGWGINTHIDFNSAGYNNITTTINAINFIGCKHIRDCPGNDSDVTGARAWSVFAAGTGCKFLSFIGENTVSAADAQLARMVLLQAQGIQYGIEGPNEWDDSFPVSLGVNQHIGATYQQQKIWPKGLTLGVPAVNISFGAGWTATNNWIGDYGTVGDLSASCTYGNAHTYPNVGQGTNWAMNRLNDLARMAAGSRPVMTTEFGWNNSQHTEANAALFVLQMIFDQYLLNNVRTYIYALFDDGAGLFGMMRQDGTPKPAGTALHNLMAILDDPGVGANRQDALSFSMSGNTANDFTVTMEKSTGVFQIAIWNESDVQHNVTLNFGAPNKTTIKTYHPLTSSTASTTASNVQTVVVSVGAEVVIVEMTP